MGPFQSPVQRLLSCLSARCALDRPISSRSGDTHSGDCVLRSWGGDEEVGKRRLFVRSAGGPWMIY